MSSASQFGQLGRIPSDYLQEDYYTGWYEPRLWTDPTTPWLNVTALREPPTTLHTNALVGSNPSTRMIYTITNTSGSAGTLNQFRWHMRSEMGNVPLASPIGANGFHNFWTYGSQLQAPLTFLVGETKTLVVEMGGGLTSPGFQGPITKPFRSVDVNGYHTFYLSSELQAPGTTPTGTGGIIWDNVTYNDYGAQNKISVALIHAQIRHFIAPFYI